MNDFQLKPHQIEGIDFLKQTNGRAIIAFDPGLGKTLITLQYVKESSGFPLVAVAPATVKGTWAAEIRKWIGDIPIHIMEGKSPEDIPEDTQVLITSYNLLAPRRQCISNFVGKTLVFDECHNLSNRETATTKAATAISRRFSRVIGLSGTPILNRPADFWPILHIIRPEEYRVFRAYAHRYCDPQLRHWGWTFDGATNLDKLAEEIKSFVIRRKRDVIAHEMPDQSIDIELLEIDNREEYEKARTGFAKWMESKGRRLSAKAKVAEKLIQVGELLRLASKLKCRNLVRYIRKYREENPNEKLILFAHHDSMVDILRRRVLSPEEPFLHIGGSIPSGKRQPIIDRFQEDPEARVIICKTLSAGAGITLTAAQTSIFCELPWGSSHINQAMSRNYRIGQTKDVRVIIAVARDTIEHKVIQVLEDKQGLHDVLIDGTNRKSLPLAELLAMELRR